MSKVVENYILKENIGVGQFGVVRRAQHRHKKEVFAVKVIMNKHFQNEPRLNQLLTNQVNTLTKICHRNVVKFIESIRTANNIYLVFEYCNGGTLAQMIKSKRRLSAQEAINLLIEIRRGYEAMCEQNTIHRDLKPSNILFHDGVLKIADFGFCKELEGNKMADTLVGSPIYMAPEVLMGLPYDARADLWSIGVILYEMIYGYCPYEQTTIPKLISLIEYSTLVFPTHVPVHDHVKLLITKLLNKDYRLRIKPSEFLKQDLNIFCRRKGSGDIKQHKIISNNLIKSSNFGEETNSEIKNQIKIMEKNIEKNQQNCNKDKNDAMVFIRKALSYLASSICDMIKQINKIQVLKSTFLIYKILKVFQTQTKSSSIYWILLKKGKKIQKISSQWDQVLIEQIKASEQLGEYLKKALKNDSLCFKTEVQSQYIDLKTLFSQIKNLQNTKFQERFINCMLIYRHFIMIIQQTEIDFTDYKDKSFQQKQQICLKFSTQF